MKKFLTVLSLLGMLTSALYAASLDEVRTWDESASAFSTTLNNAEPIDRFITQAVSGHASTTYGGTVYTAFTQTDGTETRVYLARLAGGDVQVWDDGTGASGGWNTDLQTADPIDALTNGQDSKNPALDADSNGNVYVSYLMEDATGNDHLYLNRLKASTGLLEIWDSGATAWSTTRTDAAADGDGIDAHRATSANVVSGTPQIVCNSDNDVFITYVQADGGVPDNHIFLVRYDYSATQAQCWNQDALAFTTVAADSDDAGDNIDFNIAVNASTTHSLATGGTTGHVYFSWLQEATTTLADSHVGFARYNATTGLVQRWDKAANWTTVGTESDDDADFIDAGIADVTDIVTGTPSMVVNSVDDVYIVYEQEDETGSNETHVRLARYDYSTTTTQVWNDDSTAFTATQSDGDEVTDSVDAGVLAKDSDGAEIALASNNDIYIAFLQEDFTGSVNHVYLSRFDYSATNVERWSADTTAWVVTQTGQDDAADMIDLSTSAKVSSALKVAVDSNDDLYIAYIQDDAGSANDHLKLSRYDYSATQAQCWDEGTTSFTSDFSLADPVDISTTAQTSSVPSIVIPSTGVVYFPYLQLGTQAQGSAVHLQLGALGTATAAALGRSSSSGTCLIADGSSSTILWIGLAFGALLVMGVGMRTLAKSE